MNKNNLTYAIWITWGVILACCISMAWLIKIYLIDNRQSSEWFFLIYSVPILISSLVFVMLLYNVKRAYTEGKIEIEQGKVLAHWKYSDEEWTKFNDAEWKKSRERSIFVPLVFFAFLLFITWLDSQFSKGDIVVAIPLVVIFFATMSASLLFYSYALYKRTLTCPREVVIGPGGFFYGGFYSSWELFGTRLAGVKLIPGDIPILEFDVKAVGRTGSSSQPLRIPVPRGRERETEVIIAALTA